MRIGPPTSKSKVAARITPFDLLWAVGAPLLALALRDPGLLDLDAFPATIGPPYIYALATTACALPAFALFRISEGMSRYFSVRDVVGVCAAVAVAVAASSVILFFFTRLEGVPRSTPLICALVMIAGLLLARMAARLLHEDEWSSAEPPSEPLHDAIRRRVILVGVDRFAAIAVKLVSSQRPRSTVVVAALDPRPDYRGRNVGGVEIVGDVSELGAIVEEYAIHGVEVDEVWLCDGAPLSPLGLARLAKDCAIRRLPLVELSSALNLAPLSAPPRGAPSASGATPRLSNDYLRVKRILDVVVASALLILLSPVALIVACLTLLDLGAPALFWQQRVGLNGRKFLLYKFRSYQAPFNGAGARVPRDSRLSVIGRTMRATHLDELPQLLNVLIGDMSLVGPRPLLPQDQPRDPTIRLMVRPGLTGWAQINGGRIVDAEEKNALDVWYVRRASFALDLRIMLNTAKFLLAGEKINASAVRDAMASNATSLREIAARGRGPAPIKAIAPAKRIMP